MKNLKFWREVSRHHLQGIKPYVLVVVDHRGSSPGKKGAKMLVSQLGFYGSIGGGVMERNLVNELELLNLPLFIELEHKEGENSSGLRCSGSQKIYICRPDTEVIDAILSGYENKPMVINYSEEGIHVGEIISQYYEKTEVRHCLHIFGGGHVGKAVSRVFQPLDFLVKVYDYRNEETITSNPYTDRVYLIDFKKFEERLSSKDYVVIVTYGIKFDLEILSSLFRSGANPKYLGLMGSKTKISIIKHRLRKQGVSDEFIGKIKAPIGLNISDGSPEEIAISIAAEVLKIKNSVKG